LRPFVETQDRNQHTLSYQSLPLVYIQNANIYITKPATIRGKGNQTGENILSFIMDESESIDINTPLDWRFAEAIMGEEYAD
jgi:CMP-N-acetylneuraminic acid synthetase